MSVSEQFIARVRAAYIRERDAFERRLDPAAATYRPGPHWDGGTVRNGTQRKNIWPGVALKLAQANIDPEGYMTHMFVGKLQSPKPNQIGSPASVEEYREWRTENPRVIARSLIDQHHAWQVKLSTGHDDELGWEPDMYAQEALVDETEDYDVLFRYCMAVRLGFTRIAARYHNGALLKFCHNPVEYEKHWSPFIPAELVEEGKDMCYDT